MYKIALARQKRNKKIFKKIVRFFASKKFEKALFRFAPTMLVILGMLIFNIYPTNAYFNDIESSEGNLISTASLDFALESLGDFSPSPIDKGETASKTINVSNVGTLGFKYMATVGNFSGDLDFCGALNLKADLHGSEIYNGNLLNFIAATSTFDALANDWDFTLSLPALAPDSVLGKTCDFDFIYQGWQTDFDGPEFGFSDVETMHNSISSASSQSVPDVCPFVDGPGKYIVYFNNKLLISKSEWFGHSYGGFVMAPSDGPVAGYLPAGEYDITLASYDNHLDPDKVHQTQFNEQWKLIMNNAGGSQVAVTNSIRDIADNEEQVIEKVETGFLVSEDISSFTAMHSAYPSTEPNSLRALCAMFEEKPSPSNNVVLNEFLPNPDGNDYADAPQGEWVELYNNNPTDSFELNNWYIRDASETGRVNIVLNNTYDFSINASSTIIKPHGWLVVYMNKEFLNNSGTETIILYNNSDLSQDSYSYVSSGVPTNKSYARIPDGVGSWVDPIPTPGLPNINESEVFETAITSTSTSNDGSSSSSYSGSGDSENGIVETASTTLDFATTTEQVASTTESEQIEVVENEENNDPVIIEQKESENISAEEEIPVIESKEQPAVEETPPTPPEQTTNTNEQNEQ